METRDPFQPPKANLEAPTPDGTASPYFSASPLKFVVMSFATFGIYEVYWFYRNWKAIRERTGRSLMPFWRAVFAVLWAYACFKEIAAHAFPGIDRSRDALALALLYLLLSVLSRLPDPWWLVTLAAFLPVMPANRWARQANLRDDPDSTENAAFSGWNVAAIVAGLLFFALILYSFTLPPE